MTCTTCNEYKATIAAAIAEADGKPTGAPEYRKVRVLMFEFHSHFDACHRPGGRYVQPVIPQTLEVVYPSGHKNTRHIRECSVCGCIFAGKANAPTCGRDECKDTHKRRAAYKWNLKRRQAARAEAV